jgi:hypothetical protein
MITQTLKNQARARGLRITETKGKRRVRKTEAVLRRDIANHDAMVMGNQAKQAKGLMTMCQALMMNVRRASPPRAPPPPPPPMMFKAPPPPPMMVKAVPKKASPPKKLSMLNELKASLNKKGLKKQFNKNAKVSTAA